MSAKASDLQRRKQCLLEMGFLGPSPSLANVPDIEGAIAAYEAQRDDYAQYLAILTVTLCETVVIQRTSSRPSSNSAEKKLLLGNRNPALVQMPLPPRPPPSRPMAVLVEVSSLQTLPVIGSCFDSRACQKAPACRPS
jgi:hypothetical protein